MSQAKARAMLAEAQMGAQRESRKEYEDRMNQNQAAANASFWGGLMGQVGLPALAAWATGGLSLGVTSALAAGGSLARSEIGEQYGGGVDAGPLTNRAFGTEQRLAYEQNLEDVYGGFDEKQWMDAGQAAITTAIAGGLGEAWEASAFTPEELAAGVKAPTGAVPFGDRISKTLGTEYKFDPLSFIKRKQSGQ